MKQANFYLRRLFRGIIIIGGLIVPAVFGIQSCVRNEPAEKPKTEVVKVAKPEALWRAPDTSTLSGNPFRKQILYGRELITNTAAYLGPEGTVAKITNGMNCQNCHLEAGTKIFGNNYGSVASLYPKFRERSGSVETIFKRVNDCMERSLYGKSLDTTSKEMRAIASYLQWVGGEVPRGTKALGSGLKDLSFLDRAADSAKGNVVFQLRCASCHGTDGEGIKSEKVYTYPPLWGKHSFSDAAGLYRLSNMAKYIKYNMPNGTTYETPLLSDEEAWDVAAFVLSQPHPHKDVPHDWPNIAKKPIDLPFGPYADTFSVRRHKFGPFKEISAFYSAKK